MTLKTKIELAIKRYVSSVDAITSVIFYSNSRKQIKKRIAELETIIARGHYKRKIGLRDAYLSEEDKEDVRRYVAGYQELEKLNEAKGLRENLRRSFEVSAIKVSKDNENNSKTNDKSFKKENGSNTQEKWKNETIVNLFLLNEKNKLLKSKSLAVFISIISALAIAFLDMPFWTIALGVTLFILTEAKDQIVSFRVSRGYFGTTTSEAIQLIKFIRENANDIDSNDGDGRRRKILNPEIKRKEKVNETDGGLQNV